MRFNLNPGAIVQAVRQGIVENLGIEEGLSRMGSVPRPEEYYCNVQHALESWPESLHALSIPSAPVAITSEEHIHLTQWWGEGGLEKISDVRKAWNNARQTLENVKLEDGTPITSDAVLMGLVERINETLKTLPYERPFMKLGTRSGKDSPLHIASDGRIASGEQALLLILTSRRLFADLANDEIYAGNPPENPKIAEERQMQAAAKAMPIEEFAQMLGTTDLKAAEALRSRPLPEPQAHLPHIWLREYRRFPRHAEFRCFINNGKYMGATQYHDVWSVPEKIQRSDGSVTFGNQIVKADPHQELVQHGWTYDRILRDYAETFKAAATTMKSAVYDVVVDRESESVLLLETNPANARTFPGIKDWARPETFNGELDWIEEPIDHTREIVLKPDQMEELRAMAEARAKANADYGRKGTSIEKSR